MKKYSITIIRKIVSSQLIEIEAESKEFADLDNSEMLDKQQLQNYLSRNSYVVQEDLPDTDEFITKDEFCVDDFINIERAEEQDSKIQNLENQVESLKLQLTEATKLITVLRAVFAPDAQAPAGSEPTMVEEVINEIDNESK